MCWARIASPDVAGYVNAAADLPARARTAFTASSNSVMCTALIAVAPGTSGSSVNTIAVARADGEGAEEPEPLIAITRYRYAAPGVTVSTNVVLVDVPAIVKFEPDALRSISYDVAFAAVVQLTVIVFAPVALASTDNTAAGPVAAV